MRKIRWGIIGCGNVTEKKSGPGFQKAIGSELVAVMRRSAELAEDYARRHQVPKWYGDAGQLINDTDVDAVYIATPPDTHKQYTLLAAAAGKPVYVEKPMARNYSECLGMIEACEKAGAPLFVAYYRRAMPRFVKIFDMIKKGTIGDVRFINVTLQQKPFERDLNGEQHWRIIPEIAGCGYFCDLASHLFDLLQYYFGDIRQADGFSANQLNLYQAEDVVSAAFAFKNGIQGCGIWNFTAYADLDRTEITGSKGKLTFSIFDGSQVVLQTNRGSETFELPYPDHVQQPLIQTIVDELLGNGKCPSTGRTAAATNRVMDQILAG